MSTQSQDPFTFSQIPDEFLKKYQTLEEQRPRRRQCKEIDIKTVEVKQENEKSTKESLGKKPPIGKVAAPHVFLRPAAKIQTKETAPKRLNFEVSSTSFTSKPQLVDREIQAVVEVKDAQTQTDFQDDDLELLKELRKKQFIRNNLGEVSLPIRGYIGPTIDETNRKSRLPLRIGLSNLGKNKKLRKVVYPDDAA